MRFLAAGLVLLGALAAPAGAQGNTTPKPDLVERLPRAWCGVFRWRGDSEEQHYTIAFAKVVRRADGRIEAEGLGLNRAARRGLTARIAVRAIVDPATGRVELRERLLSDTPRYRITGRHVGTLAPNLRSMQLVSPLQGNSRLEGDLVLNARPAQADLAQTCAPPSS